MPSKKKPIDIDDLRKEKKGKDYLYKKTGPVLSRNILDLRAFSVKHTSPHSHMRTIRMMCGLPVELTNCAKIPVAYERSSVDPDILIPKDDEFKLLVQAKHYVRRKYSLIKVAQWFTLQAGKYLSWAGLRYLLANRLPNDVCAQPIEERRKKFLELLDYYKLMDEELFGVYQEEEDKVDNEEC